MKFTIFYDGKCPLCQAEILFLSHRNEKKLLAFVDINTDQFDAHAIGITCDQAMAAIYGQFENGELISGVAVFEQAYRRARLPFLAWLFARKLLQPFLYFSYVVFAKYRHAISRALGPSMLRLVEWRLAKKNKVL